MCLRRESNRQLAETIRELGNVVLHLRPSDINPEMPRPKKRPKKMEPAP